MWNKIKTIVITVLATLGVLFIILMIIHVDEDDEAQAEQVAQTSQDVQDLPETQDIQEVQEIQETPQPSEDTEETPAATENAASVAVNIPASEISDKKLKFTTQTLDGKRVDQSIFAEYDITLVHVWGTYCGPCISEMGKYAHFYDTIPDNVNMIGIVCDVYDGLDNNVDDANDILSEAGAGFMNLRTSDSVFDITQAIQVIPSSFFVDREGHIIGEMMMGKHYDDTISRLNGYLR